MSAFFLCSWMLLAGSVLQPVANQDLCITSGHLNSAAGNMLTVREPRMRAVLRYVTPQVAELRFKYMGSAVKSYAFSSGISRQQIGLKLRAKDPCNLLYVMWRISPEPGVVVSLKRNPDQHTSSACGGTGYHNIKAVRAAAAPALAPGQDHRLRVEMLGNVLTVRADNAEVWHGPLGDEASILQGPLGLRSDNARFDLQLLTLPTLTQARVSLADDEHACHSVDSQDTTLDEGDAP